MSLFSSKQDVRFVYLFHIGSAEVRAALVRIEVGKPSEIIYSTASHIPFLELTDRERYERAMLATLLEVTVRVTSEKISQLSSHVRNKLEYICVLSSPWFVEATNTIVLKKTKPFVVTPALIDELGKKEEERFLQEISTPNTKNTSAEVERELLSIQLNGYETGSFYDKKTQELRCVFHFSNTSEKLRSHIHEALSQHQGSNHITFMSSTFMAYRALGILLPQEKNYIQVVVSGECTDLSLVEHGLFLETQTFPHGTRSVLREMTTKSKMSMEEAESRVGLYFSNKQALRTDDAYAIFKKAFDTWSNLFLKTAARLSQGTPLPLRVLIIARTPWHEMYEAKLKTLTLGNLTLNTETFVASSLTEELFTSRSLIQTTSEDTSFDINIATDSIGILSGTTR